MGAVLALGEFAGPEIDTDGSWTLAEMAGVRSGMVTVPPLAWAEASRQVTLSLQEHGIHFRLVPPQVAVPA